MNKIKNEKNENIFGALKLIEQLYLDDKIPGYVFRSILQEYRDVINASDFICYKESKRKEGV